MITHYAKEVEVLYKPRLETLDLTKVNSSKDINSFLRSIWTEDIEYRERFYAIYLNRQNKILGYYLISIGGSCATVVEPKLIFQPAINMHAASIILAHNHPSGNLTPSDSDLRLTHKICEAAKMLEMTVLDHVILTNSAYYSFADSGNL